ncbi:MAG: hypothetical protein J7623_11335 [Chitinophaga sp.]|uniref:M57 family metalloprotease n=1 Tax=Chitinophaga sp. TaxID=1869181 RepID=UPI001B19A10F|nr:M57 family metalloprotease [Chitinophaga sp.]MBO9729219.1 hypothetical protein [Chitinophaga sp.]
MKTKLLLMGIMGGASLFMYSCKKNDAPKQNQTKEIPQEVLTAIKNQGFSTNGVVRFKDGYVVEGDIFLTDSSLAKKATFTTLKRGETEQYRTTQLVTNLPRTIKVYVSGLGTDYVNATNDAIQRYNDLRLGGLTFTRVTNSTDADITISGFYDPYTPVNASSGFPTANGNPYSSISVNTARFFQSNTPGYWAASVIQHELGHCIGMRHTDYMNRAFSCGFGGAESDPNNVGAIYIPNTLTGVESESWMLACMPDGISRSFTVYDIFALSYLYTPGQVPTPQLFHEWYNGGKKDHTLSANTNIQNLFPGFNYIGASHRVYLTNVSGTVPLYQFYNGSSGDHLLSTDINATAGYSGWQFDGTVAYVYNTQVAGTIPIYCYYDLAATDRVFTTDPNFRNQWPSYAYYGIAYYAFPK